jgi:hypothetical protein
VRFWFSISSAAATAKRLSSLPVMAEADLLQRQLIEAQNADGGWAYQKGGSWTEATAFALLALQAHNNDRNSAYGRGCLWLQRTQRCDGGWPPNPAVNASTWVTSLAALALPETDSAVDQCRRAVQWVIGQIEPDINPIERFVFRTRGIMPPLQAGGSPWFPHTAPWIAPTAMSVLALSSVARTSNEPQLRSLIRDGQRFILCRRCRDGGWNHGGYRYLSGNAPSYPEMTGIALLALYGMPACELDLSLKLAKAHLDSPASIEALSWLQLALVRHGRDPMSRPTSLPCRTIRDVSLRLLALAANSSSNRFVTGI